MTRNCPDLFTQMNMEQFPLPEIFFNTTKETGATLREYRSKAAAQDQRILEIMQDIGMASPSQVWAAMGKTCPLTSIRRGLTNLTTAGKLEKTAHKVPGAFGRPEHTWKLVTQEAK